MTVPYSKIATPSNFCRPATPTGSLLFAAPRPERPSDPANPGGGCGSALAKRSTAAGVKPAPLTRPTRSRRRGRARACENSGQPGRPLHGTEGPPARRSNRRPSRSIRRLRGALPSGPRRDGPTEGRDLRRNVTLLSGRDWVGPRLCGPCACRTACAGACLRGDSPGRRSSG